MVFGLLQEGNINNFRRDSLVYLWELADLSRPKNKITFPDPLIQIAYNPCILTVKII
jgi:hypothetical protein